MPTSQRWISIARIVTCVITERNCIFCLSIGFPVSRASIINKDYMLIDYIGCLPSDLWQYICNDVWPLLFTLNAKDIQDSMQELAEQAKHYIQLASVSKHWYREMIKARSQIRRLAPWMTVKWDIKTFMQFPGLIMLKAGPKLSRLPSTNIKWLDLSCNKTIGEIQLLRCTGLETLILDKNAQITDEALKCLTSLTSLSLKNNKIVTAEGLLAHTRLKSLNLSDNISVHAQEVPMTQLTTLEILDISRNYSLSNADLRSYTNLTRLDLANNTNIVDATLMHLTRLKSLNLAHNCNIHDAALYLLTSLEELNLTDNRHISDDALNHISLTKLTVSAWNNITFDTGDGGGDGKKIRKTVVWTLSSVEQFLIYILTILILFYASYRGVYYISKNVPDPWHMILSNIL